MIGPYYEGASPWHLQWKTAFKSHSIAEQILEMSLHLQTLLCWNLPTKVLYIQCWFRDGYLGSHINSTSRAEWAELVILQTFDWHIRIDQLDISIDQTQPMLLNLSRKKTQEMYSCNSQTKPALLSFVCVWVMHTLHLFEEGTVYSFVIIMPCRYVIGSTKTHWDGSVPAPSDVPGSERSSGYN